MSWVFIIRLKNLSWIIEGVKVKYSWNNMSMHVHYWERKKKHDIRWNNRVLRQIVGNWNEETDQMCAVNTWLVDSIFSSIIKMLKMTCRIVVVVEVMVVVMLIIMIIVQRTVIPRCFSFCHLRPVPFRWIPCYLQQRVPHFISLQYFTVPFLQPRVIYRYKTNSQLT